MRETKPQGDLISEVYERPTSFPGSLIFPPPSLAPGGGKMKDPGNDVDERLSLNHMNLY